MNPGLNASLVGIAKLIRHSVRREQEPGGDRDRISWAI
jgi:hypothetical protein